MAERSEDLISCGRLLLRVIASRFDAYLPKKTIPSELLRQAR